MKRFLLGGFKRRHQGLTGKEAFRGYWGKPRPSLKPRRGLDLRALNAFHEAMPPASTPDKSAEYFRALTTLAKSLTASLQVGDVLKVVMESVSTLFSADNWSLLLYDPETADLYFAIVVGKEASPRKSETDWARIDAMRDEDIVIDEDAPEITDEMWARAMPFVPPAPKVHASFRLDSNVLDWYRGHGKGYQALVNHALRVYMDHARAA